jgi:hypothetical protein
VWEQGFIDYHREDAARVLDFPHAAGYVAQIGRGVWASPLLVEDQLRHS